LTTHPPGIEFPIFIVGTIRSGTTLLADLLGTSGAIAHCGFELKDIWSRDGGVPMASPKTRDTICPECGAGDIRAGMAEALAKAFRKRMDACEGKMPGAVLLNKNPHLCNKLPLVLELFPTARIIWIHREMHKVVASTKRLFVDVWQRQKTWHHWPLPSPSVRNRCWGASFDDIAAAEADPGRTFPGGDVSCIAEYWLESNRAVAEFLSSAAPGIVCGISEEALLADPPRELARLFRFLGLPSTLDDVLIRGIDKSRDARWRIALSEAEMRTLDDFVLKRGAEIDAIFPGRNMAACLREALAFV
jgi:hypothetical protein